MSLKKKIIITTPHIVNLEHLCRSTGLDVMICSKVQPANVDYFPGKTNIHQIDRCRILKNTHTRLGILVQSLDMEPSVSVRQGLNSCVQLPKAIPNY